MDEIDTKRGICERAVEVYRADRSPENARVVADTLIDFLDAVTAWGKQRPIVVGYIPPVA